MKNTKKLDYSRTPRLFVSEPLHEGLRFVLNADQSHYLKNVLRCQETDIVRLFNGKDGEFLAQIGEMLKKGVSLILIKQTRLQPPKSELYYAPAILKKSHFDYAFEKATELGVSTIYPLITERTQIKELNLTRAYHILAESSEQSERLDCPVIVQPQSLIQFLSERKREELMIVAAEWGEAEAVASSLMKLKSVPRSTPYLVTGPEGGFSQHELDLFAARPNTLCVRLGSRILRADTAGIALIVAWQALNGDWVS